MGIFQNEQIRRRFPGLERRRFALPNQRFVSLQRSSSDTAAATVASDLALHGVSGALAGMTTAVATGSSSKQPFNFANLDKKIGYFSTPGATASDDHHHLSVGDEFLPPSVIVGQGSGFSGGGGGAVVGSIMSSSSDSSESSSEDDDTRMDHIFTVRQKPSVAPRARENER